MRFPTLPSRDARLLRSRVSHERPLPRTRASRWRASDRPTAADRGVSRRRAHSTSIASAIAMSRRTTGMRQMPRSTKIQRTECTPRIVLPMIARRGSRLREGSSEGAPGEHHDLPGTEEQRQHEGQDDRERGGIGTGEVWLSDPDLDAERPRPGVDRRDEHGHHACHRERHEEPHEPVLGPDPEARSDDGNSSHPSRIHVAPRGGWGCISAQVGPRRNGRQLGIHRLRNARGSPEGRQGPTRRLTSGHDYVESRNSVRGVCCS